MLEEPANEMMNLSFIVDERTNSITEKKNCDVHAYINLCMHFKIQLAILRKVFNFVKVFAYNIKCHWCV